MRIIIAFVLALFSWQCSAAEIRLKFEDYSQDQIYTGRANTLKWDNRFLRQGHLFAFQSYEEMVADPTRQFDGRYAVLSRHCGYTCQDGVLVDRETGRLVAKLPNTVHGWKYEAFSNVLIVIHDQPFCRAWNEVRSAWDKTTCDSSVSSLVPLKKIKKATAVLLPNEVVLPVSR